jgi:PAS domain S-box-containing protein
MLVPEKILVTAMEELRDMTAVDVKPKIDKSQFEALIDPLIKRDKEMMLFETVHARKNGSLYPVEVRLQLMHEEDPPVYVAIIQDITERKKLEEQLLKNQGILEELIEKRTQELNLSNQQLLHAEKLSAIGKLSASFAHEFNNPLYGVRNILQEIREDIPMSDADLKMVDIALSESNRMASLIEKLKSFYRPSTNEFIYYDVHQVIRDMILLQKRAFVEKNITLSLNFDGNLPELRIIPDQLKQVILNILQNSQDAIEESTGGSITITTRFCQNNAEICIEDSGSGISEENKALIFEPFFTTKPEITGTGLGLSVSYGIIKNHNGIISIDSASNKGTRVTISLPACKNNSNE